MRQQFNIENINEHIEALLDVVDSHNEVCEPYDPAYLTNNPYEIPDIPSYEKRMYRRISIIEKKLRKNKIRFEFLPDWEVFRVKKYRKINGQVSEYPTYQYIAYYMDSNEYAFGGEEEDFITSTRITDVIKSVMEWLSNNKPGLK